MFALYSYSYLETQITNTRICHLYLQASDHCEEDEVPLELACSVPCRIWAWQPRSSCKLTNSSKPATTPVSSISHRSSFQFRPGTVLASFLHAASLRTGWFLCYWNVRIHNLHPKAAKVTRDNSDDYVTIALAMSRARFYSICFPWRWNLKAGCMNGHIHKVQQPRVYQNVRGIF